MRKVQLKFGPGSEFFSKGTPRDDAAKLPGEKNYDFVIHFSTQLTATIQDCDSDNELNDLSEAVEMMADCQLIIKARKCQQRCLQ